MVNKKDLIIVGLATFCLTVTLFLAIPTRSLSPSGKYDQFVDLNNDGKINILDAIILSNHYGTNGTAAVSKASMQYDSGWINIVDKQGQFFNVTDNLNSTDVMVDITGKVSLDGGVHQRNLGMASGESGWNATFGGANADKIYSLIQTADGGYALAGCTYSFGAGNGDFWLVKTNANGLMQWNKTYGGTSHDEAHSVVQTVDGGFAIVGNTQSFVAADCWLVKTDANGVMQWNRTFGGANTDEACSVIQTSDGGYALACFTHSFGSGMEDAWLVKTDDSGIVQWSRTFGGTNADGASSIVQTRDGGYALAGYTMSSGAGVEDGWLIRINSESGVTWTDSTANTITLYRGATDPYWNYVRVRIWTKDG